MLVSRRQQSNRRSIFKKEGVSLFGSVSTGGLWMKWVGSCGWYRVIPFLGFSPTMQLLSLQVFPRPLLFPTEGEERVVHKLTGPNTSPKLDQKTIDSRRVLIDENLCKRVIDGLSHWKE
jgi:hypothetical protein